MEVLRLLVPLAVFGAVIATLVLRWAAGRPVFTGETDTPGTSSSESGSAGWCGDGDDGGSCDGGH